MLKLILQPALINGRSFKHYDLNMFLEDIVQEQWENISLVDDIDRQLNHFNHHFFRILDRHPVKTIKVRYCHSLFMNDEIKEMMKKRDCLHRVVWQTKRRCVPRKEASQPVDTRDMKGTG
jgi:5-methylcytosine-specific restriction endonuclease McrBC GTP-binding regulatory subunit McrB